MMMAVLIRSWHEMACKQVMAVDESNSSIYTDDITGAC
jgi:hypothetical protein